MGRQGAADRSRSSTSLEIVVEHTHYRVLLTRLWFHIIWDLWNFVKSIGAPQGGRRWGVPEKGRCEWSRGGVSEKRFVRSIDTVSQRISKGVCDKSGSFAMSPPRR